MKQEDLAGNETGHPDTAASSSAGTARHDDKQVTLKDLEAQHITELLDQFQGNRKKAAEALGISERTMYRKLKHLGIT
jgi:DNA-binding NtrC family response regulator